MNDGGFSIIIGNPPYIRVQNLPANEKEWLAANYKSPYGSYDIYVPFMEKGLNLLNQQGLLGFILPNKFFQSTYGKNIRELITTGDHLHEIVDFGDNQIFTDATTYTCILILSSKGRSNFKYTKVDDIEKWRATSTTSKSDTGTISAPKKGTKSWSFVTGAEGLLFNRLKKSYRQLSMLTDIFVGIQTSADDIFILKHVTTHPEYRQLLSKSSGQQVELENDIVFPIISGTDVKRYGTLPNQHYVIFPYEVEDNKANIIPLDEIETIYPKTASYLIEHQKQLEARENGRLRGSDWHGYIYLKNMYRQFTPKLCVPRLVNKLHAAYDAHGEYILDNVDVGGITLKDEYSQYSYLYLLGLLNSNLLAWYFPHVSVPFRGGYFSANKQFLGQLPIPLLDLSKPEEKAQHDRMVELVERMLQLHREHAAASATADDRRHLLQHQIEQTDAAIDTLVYQLYGLTDEEIAIVEGAS
jgi:hypothetical protein